MDVVDPLEPSAVVGGEDKEAKPVTRVTIEGKTKRVKVLKEGSHTEVVLGLS